MKTPLSQILSEAKNGQPAMQRPQNVFRRHGEFWVVRYNSLEAYFKHRDGFSYIQALLAARPSSVDAIDLLRQFKFAKVAGTEAIHDSTNDLHEESPTYDPHLTKSGRADLNRRLEELKECLATAQADGNPGEVGDIKADIAAAEARLRKTSFFGHQAQFKNERECARNCVRGALRVARSAILKVNPSLARHLKASIILGNGCRYVPTIPVEWSL